MRIVRLTAENVKRLKAVEIHPDPHMQVIGGDYQLWIERVGDGDEGAVIIEDGEVAR